MLKNSDEIILGIDLGTDFSVCGVYINGHPEIIPNEYGLSMTPSVVLFEDEMKSVAGSRAKGYSLRFRDSIISEMKRVIGLKYDEVSERVKKYFPLGLDKDEEGKVKILVNFTNNFKRKLKNEKQISINPNKINSQNIYDNAFIIKDILNDGNCNLETKKELKGFYPENICAQILKTFKECAALKQITLPSGIKEIPSYFFDGCVSLEIIDLPSGVTKISEYSFRNCKSLVSVTFPATLKTIDGNAFLNCSSLTEITLPDSLKTIDAWAFKGCTKLNRIRIPESVTKINAKAFLNCKKLTICAPPESRAAKFAKTNKIPFIQE